jgi:DNA-binding NarL/FixJ family response regulator
MITTIDINDRLLREARRVAATEHISVEALVEDGLLAALTARRRVQLDPPTWLSANITDGLSPGVASLTERELEVIHYLVAGRTNSQIAAALCLVTKTVEKRVSNILDKLGFDRRSQVAAWAVAQGLAAAPADMAHDLLDDRRSSALRRL